MSRLNRNLPSWFRMAPLVVFSLGRSRLSSESIIGPRDRIRRALVERTARDISRGAGRWVKQDNSLLCYSQLHTRYAQHSCWAYRYSKPGLHLNGLVLPLGYACSLASVATFNSVQSIGTWITSLFPRC